MCKPKWKFVGRIGVSYVWECGPDIHIVNRDDFWRTSEYKGVDIDTMLALIGIRRSLES